MKFKLGHGTEIGRRSWVLEVVGAEARRQIAMN